jgi:beta-glucosidase
MAHFGVSNQAVLELVTGEAEPSALLPFQMPATMRTVDEQSKTRPATWNPSPILMTIPGILLLA